MSEDTHAHHVLRAQAIHNDTKSSLNSARRDLSEIETLSLCATPTLEEARRILGKINAIAALHLEPKT